MRTALTELLETFNLPREALVPLREAELCYRTGAYRASLLFSYVGWGLTLRARVLQASAPAQMAAGQWQNILNHLNSEDEWDKKVFDLTQQQNNPVFAVHDDLRHQVKYWKDRRNDCAHFKDNEINHSHVEAIWQFMLSNLGKFVPNGSAASLLVELSAHFNYNLTPRSASVDQIVRRIPHSVEPVALPQFFEQCENTLSTQMGQWAVRRLPELNKVFDAVVRCTNDQTVERLSTFLLVNLDRLLGLLREYPQHVNLLSQHPQVVRNLWRQHLFMAGFNDFPLFASLLRNNLIPAAEQTEAHDIVIRRISAAIPSPADEIVLQQNSFFQVWEQIIFQEQLLNVFDWGNRNASVVVWYLSSHPISVAAVRAICIIFHSEPYPFGARDALAQLFATNPQKHAEFTALAQQQQIALPPPLFNP